MRLRSSSPPSRARLNTLRRAASSDIVAPKFAPSVSSANLRVRRSLRDLPQLFEPHNGRHARHMKCDHHMSERQRSDCLLKCSDRKSLRPLTAVLRVRRGYRLWRRSRCANLADVECPNRVTYVDFVNVGKSCRLHHSPDLGTRFIGQPTTPCVFS